MEIAILKKLVLRINTNVFRALRMVVRLKISFAVLSMVILTPSLAPKEFTVTRLCFPMTLLPLMKLFGAQKRFIRLYRRLSVPSSAVFVLLSVILVPLRRFKLF